ncbi:MAG: PKD domain-containing protein [Bacteroidales bacterium]|jgi:PKD repeat protein|nr:PKD domain-containing protein [Bacteroidales bacterium]
MKKIAAILIFLATGCSYLYSQSRLEAAFRAEPIEIQAGEYINFYDETIGTPSFWRWSFPGSVQLVSFDQNPANIRYVTPGTYDVILEVENSTSIDTEIDYGLIVVNPNTETPIANFTADYLTIPVGSVVRFTNISQNGPFTDYAWEFEGGSPLNSSDENPVAITYLNVGTYYVELSVTREDGLQDVFRYPKCINVIPAATQTPVADFEADRTFITPGDVINFADLSRNNPYRWEWKFEGINITSTEKNPSGIIYPRAGRYSVQLIVHNDLGPDTIRKENYVVVAATDPCFSNPVAPIADFVASNRLIRSGTKVYFRDRSQNTPTIWSWQFEGGFPTYSTASNIIRGVEYNTAGIYDVFMSVNNACGGNDHILKENYILVFSHTVPLYCDTINHIGDDENITSPNVNGTWGKIGGHNGLKIRAYAEKFEQYTFDRVDELVFATPQSIKAKNDNSYIMFYVWDGNSQYPGEILGEKKVLLKDIRQNFYGTIAFDNPIDVNGPFFVGYSLNYASGANTSANNDEFAINVAYNRGVNGTNTLYVMGNDSIWKTSTVEFGYSTSSTIAPRSCLVESGSFEIDNNIEIYPNPATEKIFINTGDLAHGKNVLIQLIDMTGRVISTEKMQVNGQNIEINVNQYPEGLYFINMIVGQHKVSEKILITK